MRHFLYLGAIALAIGLIAACGSGASTHGSGGSSCGYPYQIKLQSRTVKVGGCSGQLGTKPVLIRVRTHQRLTVISVTNPNGSLAVTPLRIVGTSVRRTGHHNGTAHYRAVAPGVSGLDPTDKSICVNRKKCTAAVIRVTT